MCDIISVVAVTEFMVDVAGIESSHMCDVISVVAVTEFMVDVAGIESRSYV
jgi:hypothetical protein